MDEFRPRKDGRHTTLFGCVSMALLISACTGIPLGREGSHDAGAAHLHAVTRAGNPSTLKNLLNHRVNPDAREPETSRTLLVTAILAGRRDQLVVLLRAGADPNLTDSVGNTALHIAAQTNQPWIALDLLNAGAQPDIRNAQGMTFLTYLGLMRDDLLSADAREGKQAVIEWLTQHPVRASPCC